jgi:5-methylcytosine-specific restriction enzyme subunit McrC
MDASSLEEHVVDASGAAAIPVRNVWLLMLWASDLYRERAQVLGGVEERPDDLIDLIAELLIDAVDARLRHGLGVSFRPFEAEIGRIRGRIDVTHTERRGLLARGRVACRFDDLTFDTPHNRYARAALEYAAVRVLSGRIGSRCRAAADLFRRAGVSAERPSDVTLDGARRARVDDDERAMLDAARLLFDMKIPADFDGRHRLPQRIEDGVWLRQLWERALFGFFQAHFGKLGWRVEHGLRQGWSVTAATAGFEKMLPGMQLDVLLEHRSAGRRIVIDAKWNALLKPNQFGREKLRPSYIYQMYAYLRSQESDADPLSHAVEGILLHPSVGVAFDESAVIQGHRLRVIAVDLTQSAPDIGRRLASVVDMLPIPSAVRFSPPPA